MTVENEFVDLQLPMLCELLDLLDQKLFEINSSIRQSSDPESDGLCDRGEYFIGVGFVAIQQYLGDTLFCTGIQKSDAFDLGPVHSTAITYANLINSAANWWKHQAEWWNEGKVPKNGERTCAEVTAIAETPCYELSNVLASICGSENMSLMAVLPFLIEWREAVHNARRER